MLNLRQNVEKYLSISDFQDKWKIDQQIGSGYYYALTYPSILSFFKENQPLGEALDLKLALIYSWNPKICEVTSDRFTQAKAELKILEESLGEEIHMNDILDIDMEKIIDELWHSVKKATSKNDAGSGVSVTKFLHFSCPTIFPMIDTNTIKKLSGATFNVVDLGSYFVFLSEWRELYEQMKASFDQISNVFDMPITRILDIMIFTPR